MRIKDITEQHLFQKQLVQSEKMDSLGVLVSSIAHEINNPNSFIKFNLPILKDYLKDVMPLVDGYAEKHPQMEIGHMAYPEFRKDIFNLLDNIDHGSERINSFVSNLKEFSQLKDRVGEQWTDINGVVEKVLSICQVQLKKSVNTFITYLPIDVSMPQISGIELLELIKNTSPSTECIMVTAVDEARMAITCLKKGAYDYLVKPLLLLKEDLVSTLHRALERRRLMEILDQIQKRHILSVYEQTGHNKSRTARLLGIGLNTLRRKLKSCGVD